MKLKRSNDRKVANAVSPNGKTPTIANTFGLPAGKAFSCPGRTLLYKITGLISKYIDSNSQVG